MEELQLNSVLEFNPRIHVNEMEYCKPEVTYQASPGKVLDVRKKVLDELAEEASRIQVSGYRKGKAPLAVLKLRYKKLIEERTQRDLVSAAHDEILFETKMKTMFSPQVIHANLTDSSFECTMVFMRKPSFDLKDYKGLELAKPHASKTADDIAEENLQALRLRNGDVVPFQDNDFVEMNDKITMDVSTVVNGNAVPHLSREGEYYTVGGGFYKEFDDNILGMSAGEERTFDVLWDEETKERAKMTVKVHMGVKAIPAALDDSFAQKLGIETLDKLRAELVSLAAKRVEQEEKKEIHQQILRRLVSAHEFDVPEWLTLMDAQQIAAQHQLSWDSLPNESRMALLDKARERLRTTLILDAIREAETDLQFSHQEILEVIRNKIVAVGQNPDKVLVEAQRSGQLYGMIAGLQQEATMDWLVKQSKIIE